MKRAAIIGLGVISAIHLAAIEQHPQITLAAACDIDESRKSVLPDKIPFYTDYKKMLLEVRPDVVHICLPHYLHAQAAMDAAELGIHVFCEKPVALNLKQAEEFAAFEAAHPEIHIGVCMQNRLNESVEMLKDLIDSGKYGQVLAAKGIVPWYRDKGYYDAQPWRGKWDTAGGGCIINQAIHTLDLLYYLGGDVASVKSSVTQLLDYGIEVEDTVTARLTYTAGGHGLFLATNANYKNESVEFAVELEDAEFIISENILYRKRRGEAPEPLAEDAKLPGSKFYYGASHAKIIAAFYDALEKQSQDYIHVRDAVMSLRLIDAIYRSDQTGAAAAL